MTGYPWPTLWPSRLEAQENISLVRKSLPTRLGGVRQVRLAWQPCWDIGFGRFVSLFPRLRDSHATILLNLRIPEPANIEFYGKCLSGEDFCNFCDSTTWWLHRGKNHEREFYDIWGRELTGPIGKEFHVHSVGFKRILKTYLEIERATILLPFTTDSGHGFWGATLCLRECPSNIILPSVKKVENTVPKSLAMELEKQKSFRLVAIIS